MTSRRPSSSARWEVSVYIRVKPVFSAKESGFRPAARPICIGEERLAHQCNHTRAYGTKQDARIIHISQ